MVEVNALRQWYTHHLCSQDRVTRHFAYLLCCVIFMTLLVAYINPIGLLGVMGAPMCTLWCVLLVTVTLINANQERLESPSADWTRLLQFLLFASAVIIFFDGTNIANRARYAREGKALLHDEMLLRMDTALLGWAFPKGQISLWLDTNTVIGVTSTIGILCTEVLQVMYASYYLWGNGLGAWLAFQYFYRMLYLKQAKTARRSDRVEWRRIQMFLTAWLGTFLFNFLLNLAVPAVSPRIYIATDYKNEVRGVFFANLIRRALTSAASNTFSAFPSGHCGLSWLTAYIGYRIGYRQFFRASFAAAITITTATLCLRYHYFVDMLFATVLLGFGVWLGGFITQPLYDQSITATATNIDNGVSDDSSSPLSSPAISINMSGMIPSAGSILRSPDRDSESGSEFGWELHDPITPVTLPMLRGGGTNTNGTTNVFGMAQGGSLGASSIGASSDSDHVLRIAIANAITIDGGSSSLSSGDRKRTVAASYLNTPPVTSS